MSEMEKGEKESKPRIGVVSFERRKYPRFNIDLPIEYYRIDSPGSNAGRARNISEGGLLIYFPERIEIGQHLKVKIFFSSGSVLHHMEMLVEVVWVDIHLGEGWGDYRSGVKFIDASQEDMTKLKDFLKNLSQ
jgi:c-di-GMP-binding flagellar brake protein YcgR